MPLGARYISPTKSLSRNGVLTVSCDCSHREAIGVIPRGLLEYTKGDTVTAT